MTTARRVIFVNRFFYPDHSATSQLLSDLAFHLARSGSAIEIITSRQLYTEPDARLIPHEEIHGVTVHRVWSTTFGRQQLFGRAIDYCSFYLSVGLAIWRRCDAHTIVVTKTDPPLLSVVVTPIAQIRGATVLNWIQDLFPEVASALNVPFLRGPMLWLLKRARNRSLKSAAGNVVLGRLMQRRLTDEGVPSFKIHIIHNWADGGMIRPIPREINSLRKSWGFSDRFVVGYSGNLGRAHEIQGILDAAECLRERSDILFVFIGGGARQPELKSEVERRSLGNVQFRPYQDRAVLAESLSAADVHLVSLKPELEGLIVPSKFYAIAAAGRPTLFIGDAAGEIADILREHHCGLSVSPCNGRALASAIEALASDRANAERMGANARRIFMTAFDQRVALRAWEAVLTSSK